MKAKFVEERIAKDSGRGTVARCAKKRKTAELVTGNSFPAQCGDYVSTVHRQLKEYISGCILLAYVLLTWSLLYTIA